MASHEIVIRLGRPFDIKANGCWAYGVREITIPFSDSHAAAAAGHEIQMEVRPVHDAGGEDYRPVVAGEVIRAAGEIGPGDTGTHCRVYWGSHGCRHLRGHDPATPHECDCCECPPAGCKPSCVAKPPYYGPETRFYGEDAEALGLPAYSP